MTRDEIIENAKTLISGQRAVDYGDAKDNFDRIAAGWNIIIENANGPITAKHVALMMDWVKTARLLETIDHVDSWVDKVGYSALGGSFDKD
jgi:hypothetical protein